MDLSDKNAFDQMLLMILIWKIDFTLFKSIHSAQYQRDFQNPAPIGHFRYRKCPRRNGESFGETPHSEVFVTIPTPAFRVFEGWK